MGNYEKFLCGIAIWTFLEGSLVTLFPEFSQKLTQKLFPKWGAFLAETPPRELRKLGAIELGFGLFIGGYLFWFT